ncbi:uncharacterized protein LOC127787607 [Diospyros lotus]|uniref:uncharacterized protein LOC127787607 n=1 Tax=Diospyros lotus TaxID=55363 RepID=UPI00224E87FD|nr:uncharacterized protein LOC127787607 [Diospyros lotus]
MDSARLLGLAVLLVVAVVVMASGNHRAWAKSCDDDVVGIAGECKQYVMKGGPSAEAPSPACCAALQKADMPCVCKKVTPSIERFIDINKVLFVADSCAVPLPHGTKCGSITIPRA